MTISRENIENAFAGCGKWGTLPSGDCWAGDPDPDTRIRPAIRDNGNGTVTPGAVQGTPDGNCIWWPVEHENGSGDWETKDLNAAEEKAIAKSRSSLPLSGEFFEVFTF